MTTYLSVEQVLYLHRELVRAFGGVLAVRDRALLESAAARPAATFGGEDLYPDLAGKAAALMHSLTLNHPFVDGNKPIGAAAAELFVELSGQRIHATDDDIETMALELAAGKLAVEALAIWFRHRLRADD